MNETERKTRKNEAETLAYKQFMRVAKKISYLQYGKWEIKPDMSDPLRKFTLEKKSEWFTLTISLRMQEYYHRAVYGDERYAWRPLVVVSGMWAVRYETGFSPLCSDTGMKLKPRMARKLLLVVDEVVIPKFYKDIEVEVEQRQRKQQESQTFMDNVNKVVGMKLDPPSPYSRARIATIKNCPFAIECNNGDVEVRARISYDELAEMAKTMGWGKVVLFQQLAKEHPVCLACDGDKAGHIYLCNDCWMDSLYEMGLLEKRGHLKEEDLSNIIRHAIRRNPKWQELKKL